MRPLSRVPRKPGKREMYVLSVVALRESALSGVSYKSNFINQEADCGG
jgi:hypothetical protein